MRPITAKSFLTYAVAGIVCALIAWGIQSCASSDDRVAPAYKAYLEKHDAYASAKSAAEIGVDQRHFEEALAGAYPIEKLPNADLQEVARDVLSWAKNSWITEKSASDQERYAEAVSLAGNIYANGNGPRLTDRTWKVKRMYICNDYGGDCRRFQPEVSVLTDPSRLLLLLNGDRSGVLSTLPTEVGDVGAEPTYPKDAPTAVDLPWTYSLRVWIVCAMAFMLGFLGLGAVIHYDAFDEGWEGSHPLDLPDFALGWLAMAAFAPGFAAAHAVKAGLRDARPWIARARAKLSPRAFDDEFSELTSRLEAMRAREQLDGNAVVLGDIDALIEKVRLSKSRRHVAELRKALDAADGYLSGLEEIDRDLNGRPAA